MKLVMALNRDELNALGYPIIVEAWDHKAYGKGKRRWLAEFTQEERDLIGRYYRIFWMWYLRRGTPAEFLFRKPSTVDLIHRAVGFFASI